MGSYRLGDNISLNLAAIGHIRIPETLMAPPLYHDNDKQTQVRLKRFATHQARTERGG